jgi:hypothetical protein
MPGLATARRWRGAGPGRTRIAPDEGDDRPLTDPSKIDVSSVDRCQEPR